MDEGGGVLREARAAVAGARVQELEPDARVVAHAERDLAHVGVDRLAQVRDRVDEGDLGGEERVRRVLDHLCRRGIGDEDRRLHVAVEIGDAHGDRGVVAADDDPRRLQEVAHRGALTQELGVRRHAHVGDRTRLAEVAGHELRGAHRHRRLVDDDRAGPQHRCDLVDDRFHRREVGGPGLRLRRLHAEEHELRGAHGCGGADHEAEPVRGQALGDERGEPLLEDRHLTLRQRAHALLIEVGARDRVPQPREARRGREPDVPGADDRDVAHAPTPRLARCRPLMRPNP